MTWGVAVSIIYLYLLSQICCGQHIMMAFEDVTVSDLFRLVHLMVGWRCRLALPLLHAHLHVRYVVFVLLILAAIAILFIIASIAATVIMVLSR